MSLAGILACCFGISSAGRIGYARLLGNYASLTGNLPAADKAVGVAPLDPQLHRIRASVLYQQEQFPEAEQELQLAVSLRPRDDYLWLELALLRDEIGNPGALAAFDQSVRLAPFYAHPSWQRGNFLLRVGRYNEAFSDLRLAASSRAELVPSLIDLAWGISKSNLQVTEQWAGISNSHMRLAFARFLAKQGKAKEAIEQYRAAGTVSGPARRELMEVFITTNAFREAYEVWKGIENAGSGSDVTAVYDGGFEDAGGFESAAFGWRFSTGLQEAKLALDGKDAHEGRQSLLVQFAGNSDPNVPLVSQFLLVEPGKRYRIKFAARAEELVSGDLPVVTVSDASGAKKRLGESPMLRLPSNDWQTFSFEFRTEAATRTVDMNLVRDKCPGGNCPIFGSLWLDSFSIEQLK